MPKSAAATAKELSDRKSKNRAAKAVAESEEIMGGIEDDTQVEEVPAGGYARMGNPFDLVSGRPMVDFWGPLSAYGFVTTVHGEYAIPVGKILRFEYREEFDRKEGQMVTRAHPVWEDAPQELIDYVAEPAEANA